MDKTSFTDWAISRGFLPSRTRADSLDKRYARYILQATQVTSQTKQADFGPFCDRWTRPYSDLSVGPDGKLIFNR